MPLTALELLRSVGLLADGPVPWGTAVRSARPGVYLVELPAPLPSAPIDISVVGTWIDRVPTLQVDGKRPSGKELAARLSAFWLPEQTVVYVGRSNVAIGQRVAAMYRTPLGSPRPASGGHWLRALRGLDRTRIWWAETDAPEEYEDAVLSAFAEAIRPEIAASLHDGSILLPFANLQTAGGDRKAHGLTGSLLPDDSAPRRSAPPTVVQLPPGAEPEPAPATGRGAHAVGAGRRRPPKPVTAVTPGASSSAAAAGRPAAATKRAVGSGDGATDGIAPRRPAAASSRARAPRAPRSKPPTAAERRAAEPVHLTADGVDKLRVELQHLTAVQRPAIVARIRAARELGDLSENADYEAARREQSFAEGRIRTIEDMLRNAVVIEEGAASDQVVIGSTVLVESFGSEESYTVVGPAEANPREGRISNLSPIGRALLGHRAGDDVVVETPGGTVHYRIAAIS